jgi:hypothetical protein
MYYIPLMNIKTEHIICILISMLLLFFSGSLVFSQDSTGIEIKNSKLFFGINCGPSKNQIINENTYSFPGLSSNSKNSFSGSFEMGYFFSKSVGLSTGLGYETYNTELFLNEYSDKYNTTDLENEPYERSVTGSDIKELQEISFISIPFCINFRFGGRFGFYINTGVSLSFPKSNLYSSSGTFTFEGYFPAYNVIFQNLPEYGFPSDEYISSSGKLDLKSHIIDGIARAGFHLSISEKIQIGLGVVYKTSLSDITQDDTQDYFHLVSDNNLINSMTCGTGNTFAQSMGLSISLRYYIK